MFKNCALCNKKFEPTNNIQKLCSAECRKKIKNTYHRKYRISHPRIKIQVTRVCIICNNSFIPTHRNINVCSEECRHKRKNEMQKKWNRDRKPLTLRKCVICGTEYMPAHYAFKTCSKECRTKLRIQTVKNWINIHPELKNWHTAEMDIVFTAINRYLVHRKFIFSRFKNFNKNIPTRFYQTAGWLQRLEEMDTIYFDEITHEIVDNYTELEVPLESVLNSLRRKIIIQNKIFETHMQSTGITEKNKAMWKGNG